MAGAADIHDDIIDESKIKEPYLTVFGKFGRDIAVLTGDTLLLKGIYALHESTMLLSKSKSRLILESVKESFLELCGGELRETELRGKPEISKSEYLEIIQTESSCFGNYDKNWCNSWRWN